MSTQTDSAEPNTSARLTTLEEQVGQLIEENNQLQDRIGELESTTKEQQEQISDLEKENNRLEAIVDAAVKKATTNLDRISELQARELEKGAHLQTETVNEHELEVQGDRLEKLTKDDGQTYFRLPESADPLDNGSVSLSYGDLLPIQQLARMDDEMLQSTANALPIRLAAKLWQSRTDSSVGDNPWDIGGKGIKEYVKASDLKHWIRRQEPGTSEAYAKKLVSRVIDAILDLSKHRVAIRKRNERKNGLEYTERRLILPSDADIPGETTSSSDTDTDSLKTADVLG
ncbi:hypothetical protein [Natronorubrum tibetense]|uniref:Uncharacterized protein n=1 Tax=Natronorubrum tibetense GA33 TaxID=1114856 RepID=L9VKS3_9EURY|nr:hypothetical protein [Natronorubrum tibetense]ELY37805.1 hypothetical protein C496_19925 [Natronorubrum tibetense GA33]